MTNFLGGGATQNSGQAPARGVPIQTSTYGQAVQKGFGTNRASGNIIYNDGFVVKNNGAGADGKGGGAAAGVAGYVYTWAALWGIGCGPISGVRKVWEDKNVYDTFADFGSTAVLFTGTYPQSPWSYLTNLIIPSDGALAPVKDPAQTYTTNRTYFVRVSFTSASGETLANTEVSLLVHNAPAGGPGNPAICNLMTVAPPTNFPPLATGWNIYVSLTTGTEKLQNATPMSKTTTWKEVKTGLVNHGTPPVADTSNLSQARNLNGIAYAGHPPTGGSGGSKSPNNPNLGFEVQWGSFYSTTDDADASLVITDILTNVHDGIQFPSAFLGSTTILQEYVLAAGLMISPLYTQQQPVAQTITDLSKALNVAPIWTSGTLSFIPYGDTAMTGNGKTYTPPGIVFNFTDDDFQPNQTASGSSGGVNSPDPVIVTRPDQSKVINSITLEYLDRTNNYNPATVQYKNLAMITQFGETPDPSSRDGHMFCLAAPAQISTALQGNRELGRNLYQWSLDSRGILYDPMDIGTLTDSGMGMNQVVVRVLEITENDDGTFTFMAEEYLQGTGHAPSATVANGSGFSALFNEDPGNTNAPIIFEAPPAITTNGGLETWIAMSGVNPVIWGGAQVWISTDNETYSLQGSQTGASRTGTLVYAISSSDTSITVNLSQSQGALASGTAADAANGTTLCYLDGELISYQTATLVSASNYTLTGCVRAFYGTTAAAHSAGTQFARLDTKIFKYPHSKLQQGQALSIKLLSFNIYGGGQQSL